MVIPGKTCAGGGAHNRKYKVLKLSGVGNVTMSLGHSEMSKCDIRTLCHGGPEKEGYRLTV